MKISKMVSTWSPRTEEGTHVFRILGYNGFAAHEKVFWSDDFSVGGYDWAIMIVPDMTLSKDENECWQDQTAVGLCLRGKNKAHVSFELRLVDQSKELSVSVHKKTPSTFDPNQETMSSFGSIKQDLLKAWTTDDDCLTIECIITVYKQPWQTRTRSLPRIEAPQPNIAERFGKLLETKDGVDVTCIVGGDNFTAHRIVLATRSPVFKAEHFGPLGKDGTEPITINDLQPAVFRALLYFIYTDSLPAMDDLEGDDRSEVIRNLLVAADRYA